MTEFLGFTLEQAARLSGLSVRQVRYWDDTGFVRPSFRDERERPFGRVYSFQDVVGLRTLSTLRKRHRIPLQELRKVGDWLKAHHDDAPWSELRFFVAGHEVYFYDSELEVHRAARRPDQTVIPIELAEAARSTAADAERLRKRTPDEIGRVEQRRYVSHNAPVLAGTRIRTEAIWNFHQAGYDVDAILSQYPRLTPDDVAAAIEFERRRHLAPAG
ncbi:MAG TPA: DUF433 domain-containing protein [Thermomicrobiaceae bacterium]|nr:DUF433 domain-containing protein [Thermomicrobiaceae bacterium]